MIYLHSPAKKQCKAVACKIRFSTITYCLLVLSNLSIAQNSIEKPTKNNTVIEEETLIIGSKNDQKFEPSELTIQLLRTPGSLGDPMQAIFSLPGIVQTDEENAEPAVQGSSPDANVFFVDSLPVGFLFHSFGQSIFNENLIKDFGLNKAGFGARYGQATGAVFDVSLRAPKNQDIKTTLDLSLLRLGGLVEGAINDRSSFYFAYRESLLPIYLAIEEDELKDTEDITIDDLPRASDYQGKYYWQIDNNSSVSIQVIGAVDSASATFGDKSEEALLDPGFEGAAKLDENFHSQGISWQNKQSQITLGHLRYNESFKIGNGEFFDSTEDTFTLQARHQRQYNKHTLTVGADINATRYTYNFDIRIDQCSDFSTQDCEFDLGERVQDKNKQNISTYASFIEDQWHINKKIKLTTGLHVSNDNYLDETYIDPRVRLDWSLNNRWSLNSSVGSYHQLPEEDEMFPIIGNPNLESISATHYVAGAVYTGEDGWSVDVTGYYKDIDNLIVGIDDEVAPFLNRGEGKAYGMELMINKKRSDRWFGWVAVSASKTERTNQITGETVLFSYDVPLVINSVINYQLNEIWNIGARWTYRTGTLYTPIIGNRENPDFPGFYIPTYGELNSQRINDFHRLDLRIEKTIGNGDDLFFIDILNIYNRNNVSGIEYIPVANSDEFLIEESEGLGFIPSIGIKFSF